MFIEILKKIRLLTGIKISDCKIALLNNDNNIDKSILWLKKKNILSVHKSYYSSNLSLYFNVIGIFIANNISIVILGSLNDFILKNYHFFKLSMYIINMSTYYNNNKLINFFYFNSNYYNSIFSMISKYIYLFSDNILFSKYLRIFKQNNILIISYSHNKLFSLFSKITVLLFISGYFNKEIKFLFKQIAMHISFSKPLFLDHIYIDYIFFQKEIQLYQSSLLKYNKSRFILKKMLNFKILKFFQSYILFNQLSIFDNHKTIGSLYYNCKIKNYFNFYFNKFLIFFTKK